MDLITTHINADFDCLGAMVAAGKLYPGAQMVFAGSQERSVREFFLHHDSFSFGIKRIKDVDFDAITRLILVDVRQSGRIGPFGDVARRDDVEVHIYDHHPGGQSDLEGTIEVIEEVGSTVTVFSHIFMDRGIEPSAEEATVMMLGLYEDTGNLLFNSTTRRDYLAGAFLLGCGADLGTVADSLVQELTREQVALLKQLIDTMQIINVHGIDICLARATTEKYVGDIAVLAHKLKDMENLDVLIVMVRMEGRIFMVGRSRIPEVHVGQILGEFGGGGHSFAASATVKEWTLVQALERLPIVLSEHIRPRTDARELMSTPVKTLEGDLGLSEAREVLNRYNINAAPVEEDERIVGIISRQVVDKAIHHGLSDVPVRDYMSAEMITVEPSAGIDTLRDLIVERNQRLVPVLEKGRLAGVITRTDLLRHMAADREAKDEGTINQILQGVTFQKKDVSRLMRSRLPERVLNLLRDIGQAGDDMQVNVFLVGGFVRDMMLNQPNLDIDVVVEGDGIDFAKRFAGQRDCRVRSHKKFSTAVIIFPDDFKIDVASTRREYYVEPAALPTVETASIRHDLARRDFTINTLAIALSGGRFGELIDFFGGQRDMKDRAIRVLHNLSFVEDPTRMFRAVRFAQRLGFRLGIHTEHLLKGAVQVGFLERVGGARLFNEIVAIFREADPLRAVSRLDELGLLKCFHPSLTIDEKTRDIFRQADRLIHWYDLLYIDDTYRKWLVYFLCLTSGLDRDAMSGVCSRLAVPEALEGILVEERSAGHDVLNNLERLSGRGEIPRNSQIYTWLDGFSIETLLFMMAGAYHEEVRRWISHYMTHLREEETSLTGHDLKELGLAPGPIYGEILHDLLMARLDGKVETRDDELKYVRTSLSF
ncbi:MAG: CBS domain-containing protein [Desulfuromonadales bacterium]